MEVTPKKVWLSKTFWVNIVALVALVTQGLTEFVIDLEAQAAILAVVNMALRIITKSPVAWSESKSTLKSIIWIVPLAIAIAAGGAINTGCSTMNIAGAGWAQEIKNWTPHQKANFFIDVWQAEHTAYKAQNGIDKKPAGLVKFLETKREMLEAARMPIRIYAQVVAAGDAPDSGLEQEIIGLIRELQMQAWKGGA